MNLQEVFISNVIDNEVVNVMEVNFLSDPLVGVLWNFGKYEVEKYGKVVA